MYYLFKAWTYCICILSLCIICKKYFTQSTRFKSINFSDMNNFSPGNIRSVVFDIFDRFVFVKFTMRSLLFHTIVVWMLLFGRALCVNVQCMILLPINHKKQNKSYLMCYIRTDAIGSFWDFTTELEETQTERFDQNVNFW